MSAPLYGLVLSGGYSTRMGSDKGGLVLAGQTQIERAMRLLTPLCERVFLSCRRVQAQWPAYAVCPQIHDRYDNVGPMGGILSAMETDSQAAWLVLACDMPRLTPELLATLVAHRAPERLATAFTTDATGLPEPLCAIYEPGLFKPMKTMVAAGRYSPRNALRHWGFQAIHCDNPERLQSLNAPDDQALLAAQVSEYEP